MSDPEPHQQLARHAVPGAEFLRPVRSHIAAADDGCPPAQLVKILGCRDRSLKQHERVGRLLVVHAERGSGLPPQGASLRARLMRHQDDVIAVKHEPDRRHMRTSVLAHDRKLAGPGARHHELAPLRVGHLSHRPTLRCPRRPQPASVGAGVNPPVPALASARRRLRWCQLTSGRTRRSTSSRPRTWATLARSGLLVAPVSATLISCDASRMEPGYAAGSALYNLALGAKPCLAARSLIWPNHSCGSARS